MSKFKLTLQQIWWIMCSIHPSTFFGSNYCCFVHANLEANRYARDLRDVPKSLELDVDSSDPFGRYEINTIGTSDAEILIPDGTTGTGTGTGADASTNANVPNASKNPSLSAPTKVPLKSVITVFFARSTPIQHHQPVVLRQLRTNMAISATTATIIVATAIIKTTKMTSKHNPLPSV
jgi:hypothetical protein